MDIFEQENDKILIHLKQWEDVPEEKPEIDDEFYGFGDDYETSTVAATTNGGGMYRISIESQVWFETVKNQNFQILYSFLVVCHSGIVTQV